MNKDEVLAIDIETNAKDLRCDPGFRVLGVSYSSESQGNDYLPFGHIKTTTQTAQESLHTLRCLLDRHSVYVFHNGKYDLPGLLHLGIDLWDTEWYDTMLMQHFIDENLPNKSLDYLGKLHLGQGKVKSEEFENFINSFGWEFIPEWMIREYAIEDAKRTKELFFYLLPEFERQGFV